MYVFQRIFQYYGLPENIGSNRGPQFISRMWNGFMEKLEVTVALNLGYHSQAKGQVEHIKQETGWEPTDKIIK